MRQYVSEVLSLVNAGETPVGSNEQYEVLFRHYLNTAERASDLDQKIYGLSQSAVQKIDQVLVAPPTSSRWLGGAFLHRVIRKLIRRELDHRDRANREAILALSQAVELLGTLWRDIYLLELDVERRTRAGIADRLAIIDALQSRLEYLEAQLIRPTS